MRSSPIVRSVIASAAIVLFALAAACGKKEQSPTTFTTQPGTASPAPVMTEPAATAATTASGALPTTSEDAGRDRFEFFKTPSGNIGCVVSRTQARCDVREHTWQAPPQPSSCDLDWGNGMEVDDSGKAGFVCAGDTTFDPKAQVLDYGKDITVATMSCRSEETGVTCTETRSGHGFTLSRTSDRTF